MSFKWHVLRIVSNSKKDHFTHTFYLCLQTRCNIVFTSSFFLKAAKQYILCVDDESVKIYVCKILL